MVTQSTPTSSSSDGITPIRQLVSELTTEFCEQHFADDGEAEYRDVAIEVRDQLVTRPDVCQYVGDLIYSLAMTQARSWGSGKRHEAHSSRNSVVTYAKFMNRERSLRWIMYTEHVGFRQVSLLKMTRADIQVAIQRRERQIDTETRRNLFLKIIDERLARAPDGSTVGDVFSDQDLEEIEREVTG